MRMKVSMIPVLVCFGLALVPGTAVSQSNSDFDFELNLFTGKSFFLEESFSIGPPQSETLLPMTFKLDPTLRTGLRLNFVTSQDWGFETFASYESATAAIQRRDGAVPELRFPVQHYRFGVDLVYYPLGSAGQRRIIPFVLAGGGAAIYRPTGEGKTIATDPLRGNLPDLIESSKALFIYGAGIKYRLTNSIGFRADVNGGVTKNPTFGLPTESDQSTNTVLPLTGFTSNTEISIGITLKLN